MMIIFDGKMTMMIMINKEGLVRIFVCLRRLGARGGFWGDIIEPANYLGIILDVMGSGMPCDVLSIMGLVYSKISPESGVPEETGQ